MTVIFSNPLRAYDDFKRLWENIKGINVILIDEIVPKKDVEKAITNEKDILILAGHGNNNGLKGDNVPFDEYYFDKEIAKNIKAKTVFGIWKDSDTFINYMPENTVGYFFPGSLWAYDLQQLKGCILNKTPYLLWPEALKRACVTTEQYNPQTENHSETKLETKIGEISLKDQYWENGNIFRMSTGDYRMVWNHSLIDAHGYIPSNFITDDLRNSDSTVNEKVVEIYAPNNDAGYFGELLKPNPNRLIWKRSKHIFTYDELKKSLGIDNDEELIITGREKY